MLKFQSLPIDECLQQTVQDFLSGDKSGLSSLAQDSSSSRESLLDEETQEISSTEDTEESGSESEEESTDEDESGTEDSEPSCEGSSGLEHGTISAHKHQSVKRLSQNGSSQPRLKKSKMVHQCQYCEYVADSTWRLKRHLVTHFGKKPFSCEKCGRRYSRSDTAKRHARSCTKTMKTEAVKNDEIQFNDNSIFGISASPGRAGLQFTAGKKLSCKRVTVKPHKCEQCQLAYKTAKSLRHHIITKHFCYRCCYCPRSFLDQESLCTHSQMKHDCGQETFMCGICNETFATCKSLELHFKDHHLFQKKEEIQIQPVPRMILDDDKITCALCGHIREYANQDSLRRHISKYHP